SHVLRAMQVPDYALRGGVRFSFSRDNTMDEVERALAIVPEAIARLRAISPFGPQEGALPAPDAAYA
ncbi:MAG TPA: cysteine desulfurase NifS, partial [Pseudolabrys sp.]|nr:cysteine desulfurase NifS [Pseudolabrys sp.]